MVHVSCMLVSLLLAAGSITLCALFQKEYVMISKPMVWDESQSYCRENHTDLVTIQSLEDMKMLSWVAAASNVTSLIWIGLRGYNVKSWMWSSGGAPELADSVNWASLPTSSQDCGARGVDGKWLDVVCNTALPFVCQADDGSYDVVLTSLTWREAQNYCRKSGKDLARVRSQTENKALQEALYGTRSSHWIGLFRDGYKWSDQSNSSFRYWQYTQPNYDGPCVLYDPANHFWWDRMCEQPFPFFCYNEITTMRWMMLKMESGPSLFSDSKTSDDLLNQASVKALQIQSKCPGLSLQWSVQPDGQIFHKPNTINDQYPTATASGSACS